MFPSVNTPLTKTNHHSTGCLCSFPAPCVRNDDLDSHFCLVKPTKFLSLSQLLLDEKSPTTSFDLLPLDISSESSFLEPDHNSFPAPSLEVVSNDTDRQKTNGREMMKKFRFEPYIPPVYIVGKKKYSNGKTSIDQIEDKWETSDQKCVSAEITATSAQEDGLSFEQFPGDENVLQGNDEMSSIPMVDSNVLINNVEDNYQETSLIDGCTSDIPDASAENFTSHSASGVLRKCSGSFSNTLDNCENDLHILHDNCDSINDLANNKNVANESSSVKAVDILSNSAVVKSNIGGSKKEITTNEMNASEMDLSCTGPETRDLFHYKMEVNKKCDEAFSDLSLSPAQLPTDSLHKNNHFSSLLENEKCDLAYSNFETDAKINCDVISTNIAPSEPLEVFKRPFPIKNGSKNAGNHAFEPEVISNSLLMPAFPGTCETGLSTQELFRTQKSPKIKWPANNQILSSSIETNAENILNIPSSSVAVQSEKAGLGETIPQDEITANDSKIISQVNEKCPEIGYFDDNATSQLIAVYSSAKTDPSPSESQPTFQPFPSPSIKKLKITSQIH